MYESFTMLLQLDCHACKTSMPVNGIVPWVRCYRCNEVSQLSAEFWSGAFEKGYFSEALGFANGEAKQVTSMGHPSYNLAYGHRIPRCQKCKGPDLDLGAMLEAMPRGGCFCPQCGGRIKLRTPDALVMAVNPRAQFVVGESAEDEAGAAVNQKIQPVLFACMGCGGGLQVDGSSRQITCQYCQAANYLPDGLWQQIHPVPKAQPWFLVCVYDHAARFADRATDEDSDVREGVAKDPSTPQEILDKLGSDEYYGVRAAVAGNPSAHPYTLQRLAADDDSDVIEALAKNPMLPPDGVVVLAQSDDYDKRKAAALHPNCPPDWLKKLAKDDDDDVKEAAKGRLWGK